MPRYVDRDAFIKQQRELYCKNCARRMGVKNGKLKAIYKIGEAACKSCELNDALEDLDDYPEADVAPVVHAHWIKKSHEWDFSPYFYHDFTCSNCGVREQDKSPYCRYCGAKMEEVKENE